MNARDALASARFGPLEALRAWLAWWVVLGHVANLTGLPTTLPAAASPLFNTGVAVNVFIVVSGFVITHALLSSRRDSYPMYLARRAARLWPVYLVALSVMVLFPELYAEAFVHNTFNVSQTYDAQKHLESQQNLAPHVALHLLLLHGLVPNEILPFAGSSILSPAWSLSLEWQFYLIAPALLAALVSRRAARWYLTVGAILVLVLLCNTQEYITWRFPSTFFHSAHFFLAGIISRIALAKLAERGVVIRASSWTLGVLSCSGVAALVVDGPTESTLFREVLIWGAFFGMVMTTAGVVSPPGNDLAGTLRRIVSDNGFVQRLGAASYSTYILHIPLLSIALYAFQPYWQSSRGVAVLVAAGSLPVIAVISLVSYRFVETPINRVVKRWARRSREVYR